MSTRIFADTYPSNHRTAILAGVPMTADPAPIVSSDRGSAAGLCIRAVRSLGRPAEQVLVWCAAGIVPWLVIFIGWAWLQGRFPI